MKQTKKNSNLNKNEMRSQFEASDQGVFRNALLLFFYVFFFFNQIFQLQLEGADYKSGHFTELSSNQIALPTLRQYLI